jgi:cytochrome c1
MPAPLAKDNFVKYQDGTGSLDQNARDVSAFLAWSADPSLNSRKSLGWLVILYLVVTTGLLYAGKKRIWAKIPH